MRVFYPINSGIYPALSQDGHFSMQKDGSMPAFD